MQATLFNFIDQTDITARKHRGNPQSVEANKKASKFKSSYRFLILDYLKRNGTATLETLCSHFGKHPHQLSGRCSELRAVNLIETTGETVNGFAVYRLKK